MQLIKDFEDRARFGAVLESLTTLLHWKSTATDLPITVMSSLVACVEEHHRLTILYRRAVDRRVAEMEALRSPRWEEKLDEAAGDVVKLACASAARREALLGLESALIAEDLIALQLEKSRSALAGAIRAAYELRDRIQQEAFPRLRVGSDLPCRQLYAVLQNNLAVAIERYQDVDAQLDFQRPLIESQVIAACERAGQEAFVKIVSELDRAGEDGPTGMAVPSTEVGDVRGPAIESRSLYLLLPFAGSVVPGLDQVEPLEKALIDSLDAFGRCVPEAQEDFRFQAIDRAYSAIEPLRRSLMVDSAGALSRLETERRQAELASTRLLSALASVHLDRQRLLEAFRRLVDQLQRKPDDRAPCLSLTTTVEPELPLASRALRMKVIAIDLLLRKAAAVMKQVPGGSYFQVDAIHRQSATRRVIEASRGLFVCS